MNFSKPEPIKNNYSISRRTADNNVTIVEINEQGCEYYDFVLIKFHYDINSCKEAYKIGLNYRRHDKAVCVIGCVITNQNEKNFTPDFVRQIDFSAYFNLWCDGISDYIFESLVKACYATRGGSTHGDPQEWLSMQDRNRGNRVFVVAECKETISESFSAIVERLNDMKENSQIYQSHNSFVACYSNEIDTSLLEFESFCTKVKNLFQIDCNTSCSFVTDYPGNPEIKNEVIFVC